MQARNLSLSLLLLAFPLLGSIACGPEPVTGAWRSTEKLGNGERNEMFIASDGSGDATLWATPEGQPDNWIRFDFNHDWEDKGSSTFEMDMECDEDYCNGDDFTMECDGFDVGNNTLVLDCKGDNKWGGYVFNWEQ